MATKNFQENQSKASNTGLQLRYPLDYAEDGFAGGTEQSTASVANISRTPFDPSPFNTGTGPTKIQSTASAVEFDKHPVHGWESYPMPPSVRAVKQGK